MLARQSLVKRDTKWSKLLRTISRVALLVLAVLLYLSVTGKQNWIVMLLYAMPTFLIWVFAKSLADDVTHADDPYRASTKDTLIVWAFAKFFRIL